MECSTDYTFSITASAVAISAEQPDLLGGYLAAMTQEALTGGQKGVDSVGAMRRFLIYATEKSNGVQQNAAIKKYLKAEKKGKLAKVLE